MKRVIVIEKPCMCFYRCVDSTTHDFVCGMTGKKCNSISFPDHCVLKYGEIV